ncbi:transketolase [Plasticicumulans lactativorans]|uniref:Transketolase n=1 Tax=Plasticicumulans lactativorans TaxID=1133106 RepID=A0A4R2L0G3_9GAMM|nr:transketolase [Plasticicumulans lactativorans]TCO79723.1 transketolase [Plasticicumulans lactativorans]
MPSRRELANAIRALSMDAVQQANSGHPGAPMGMADIAEVLWNGVLRHNPGNPHWVDRDRFVLSNGHASMLLYSLLHLSGYPLDIDDLRDFRQLHSKTPGHPEYGITVGVETTTGPLGQGFANAVGMALAERTLAAQFNRAGHTIVDHHTYVFVGDGCLMEGISHEAASLAGTLGLGKLIALYDDNGISIDGDIEGWFADDTAKRFEAYGWQVIRKVDGHDPVEVATALATARAETTRPTLICCRTVIGYGAPNKQGGHDVHGAPLGRDEVAAARAQLGWSHPPFVVPPEIYAAWDARPRGAALEGEWQARFDAYRATFPELAYEFERRSRGALPLAWSETVQAAVAAAQAAGENIASRAASQKALNAYGPVLPELFGGSADLTPSNNTLWKGSQVVSAAAAAGNYLHYGVREFGMCAVMNGMALHGGFIPYGGTFLVFSDYARNALRVAALAKVPSVFVFTHDSIGLGEDGPTHQPVEHLASLRVMPGITVWRPCDAVESMVAWQAAIERRDGPSALVFSRQNLPHQARDAARVAAIGRGGYVLVDSHEAPELILIATGSEVGLAVAAATELAAQGRRVRVVSMPCTEVFEAQDAAYREAVLPPACRVRIAIEAGATLPWYKYVGFDGRVIGLDRFGESAPAGKLFEHFGFTVAHVVQVARELL